MSGVGLAVLAAFGTDAQKRHHIPKLTSGEYAAGSFALSSLAGDDIFKFQGFPAGKTLSLKWLD